MDLFARIASVVALFVSGAALVAALTHTGPAGPAGPRGPQGNTGQTGKSAQLAHLGLCWNFNTWSAGGSGITPIDLITSPVLTDGVPSCPDGQFVSIVPH